MDLLIIKTGDHYIRVRQDAYVAMGMDKASVFPMSQLDRVKDHLTKARNSGFPEAAIYRLHLTEEPLEDA